MKKYCPIVEDLLPLYVEDLASDESKALIEEHLTECDACTQLYHTMKDKSDNMSEASSMPLKTIKSRLHEEKKNIFWMVFFGVSVFALALFSWISLPKYLPFTEDQITVTEQADGDYHMHVGGGLTSYNTWVSENPDDGTTALVVEAWTSTLDRFLGKNKDGHTLVIPNFKETYDHIEYSNHSIVGQPPIYQITPDGARGISNHVFLPRLALVYYFRLAIGVAGVALILWIILRKKTIAWIPRTLFFLGISYPIAHVLIKGFTTASYHMERDLLFISLTGLLGFGFLHFAYQFLKDRIIWKF